MCKQGCPLPSRAPKQLWYGRRFREELSDGQSGLGSGIGIWAYLFWCSLRLCWELQVNLGFYCSESLETIKINAHTPPRRFKWKSSRNKRRRQTPLSHRPCLWWNWANWPCFLRSHWSSWSGYGSFPRAGTKPDTHHYLTVKAILGTGAVTSKGNKTKPGAFSWYFLNGLAAMNEVYVVVFGSSGPSFKIWKEWRRSPCLS